MVLPTKEKPRIFKALLTASESGVEVGIRPGSFQALCWVRPLLKDQMKASKLP